MYEPTTMMTMYRATSTSQIPISFALNLFHRELVVTFPSYRRDIQISAQERSSPNTGSRLQQSDDPSIYQPFRFIIPFSQLHTLREVQDKANTVLLVSMETPPSFYRKLDEVLTHDLASNRWSARDAWFRQTDIVYKPGELQNAPLTLKRNKPIIDIGTLGLYCSLITALMLLLRSMDYLSFCLQPIHSLECKVQPDVPSATGL